MMQVVIVIPRGQYSMVNIEGTVQIFDWVNQVYGLNIGENRFDITYVGVESPCIQPSGLCLVKPDQTIDDSLQADLIILPAVLGNIEEAIGLNQELYPWLVRQYRDGAEIASLGLGTFLLAETGLLNGRPCSTHWAHAKVFRRKYPEAILQDEKILTENEGIYTSAGAFAFTHLIVHLVEKFTDKEMAILTSKAFMIDIDAGSQSQFMIFSGQKNHGDEKILATQEYLEAHYQDKINVDELSEKFKLGRRTLERKFKKATNNSIIEYLQRVKVEAAKRKLEPGHKTVNEVMYEVGYTDAKAFREVFKKYAGCTPVEYLRKYSN